MEELGDNGMEELKPSEEERGEGRGAEMGLRRMDGTGREGRVEKGRAGVSKEGRGRLSVLEEGRKREEGVWKEGRKGLERRKGRTGVLEEGREGRKGREGWVWKCCQQRSRMQRLREEKISEEVK